MLGILVSLIITVVILAIVAIIILRMFREEVRHTIVVIESLFPEASDDRKHRREWDLFKLDWPRISQIIPFELFVNWTDRTSVDLDDIFNTMVDNDEGDWFLDNYIESEDDLEL